MKTNSLIRDCTSSNFDAFLEASETKKILFYFHAPWCGPCRMLKPLLNRLAEKHKDKLIIGSIDVDEDVDLVRKFDVFSVPSLFLYKDRQLCKSCQANTFNLNSILDLEKELVS